MNVHDRVVKLLALAESPNEAEAIAALLKARELMMKHKLSEEDFEIKSTSGEVKEIDTGVTCSRRRDAWIETLGNVIADNHCCKSFMQGTKGKQTVKIMFWGLADDVTLCDQVFRYALSSIQSWLKEHEDEYGFLPANVRRSVRHSYADGYIDGIEYAYRSQREEHQEWGLVAVMPKEVQEKASTLGSRNFSAKVCVYSDIYQKGYEDGCEFDPGSKLESHDDGPENEMEL